MFLFAIIFQCFGCMDSQKDTIATDDDGVLLHQNHGITKVPKTIRIRFLSGGVKKYLIIENSNINRIRLKDNFSKVFFETGDLLTFDQRPFRHRFFVFPIDQSIKNQDLNLTLDKSGENLSYTIKLLDENKWAAYLRLDHIMIGSIVGFYGLAILLAFSLALYHMDMKYIYFLLYITLSLAWILNDGGILYESLWSSAPNWHKSSRGFFSSSTMILFALYLSRNDNKMLTTGIMSILFLLIALMAFKFLIAFVVSKGLYPDSLKYISMNMNAVTLLLLMSYIMSYMIFQIKKNIKDLYEILAIVTYCFFVIHLSSKELGLTLINTSAIHHFDAIIFFPIQCLFMSIHMYKKDKERKQEAEKTLVEYKIQQQRILDQKVLETEENEKKRIAQNIHDEIGSIFIAIKYQILSLKKRAKQILQNKDFDDIVQLSEEGIKKQYSIIDDLLLEFKLGKGVKQTLQSHLDLIVTREDITLEFIFDAEERIWTDFQKAQVFRIILELVTNTIKHAKANCIRLHIYGTKQITISYTDNGKGFNCYTVTEGRGLTNIKMRVNSLNGKMHYDSSTEGTSYHINFELTHE